RNRFRALRGHPRRARRRLARRPGASSPAHHLQRSGGGRDRRGGRDALFLLRPRGAHLQDAEFHRRDDPRWRHRLHRGSHARDLVSGRAPHDRDHRDGRTEDTFHERGGHRGDRDVRSRGKECLRPDPAKGGAGMKLYSYWRSSASWRVRTALAYKGLSYDYVPVHLTRDGGEQHKEAYREKNPMRQVPLLELDDGRTLAQSVAILEYLEEVFPEPPLLPRDPYLRGKVRQL